LRPIANTDKIEDLPSERERPQAFATATPCAPNGALSREQVTRWREQGYCLASGVFESRVIEDLLRFAESTYPAPDTPEGRAYTDFGGLPEATFPSPDASLNAVTLHPHLLAAIGALLGVPPSELRLTQSDLWPKYGRSERPTDPLDNNDQRIHVDYPNHFLTHPPPWHQPEAVELIVYLSDGRACRGGTAVVPREGPDDPAYPFPIIGSPGIGDTPFINDREAAEAHLAAVQPEVAGWREALYDREVQVDYRRGDVLFYRHDTWHRGTPLAPGTCRFAQNITYRTARAEWISTAHAGWAWNAYRAGQPFEKMIAQCTVDQRAVLGFPQPGSTYWCEETLEAVEARYGPFGMDMAPYRDALLRKGHGR
jgi:hypothetical protein